MIAHWEILQHLHEGRTRIVATGSDPLAPDISPEAFVRDLVLRWAGDTPDVPTPQFKDSHWEWYDTRSGVDYPLVIMVQFIDG